MLALAEYTATHHKRLMRSLDSQDRNLISMGRRDLGRIQDSLPPPTTFKNEPTPDSLRLNLSPHHDDPKRMQLGGCSRKLDQLLK